MFGRSHRNGNGNGTGRAGSLDEIVIRSIEPGDRALRRLAELDTARMPSGTVVGAERRGHLVAAISVTSGEVVADPFHPTADLVALLRLRAGQAVPPLA